MDNKPCILVHKHYYKPEREQGQIQGERGGLWTHKLVWLSPLGNASLGSQRPVGPSESEAKTSSPDRRLLSTIP